MYEDLKYKIVHNEGASAVYLPIPLSKIKSAEIVSSVTFQSSAEFDEFPGCCSFINEVYKADYIRHAPHSIVHT